MFDDTGQFCVGSGAARQCRHNSGHAVDGSLDLTNALKVSSDDFFYNLGARLNPSNPAAHPNGGPLDTWARRFGIGRDPGIDVPGAATGTLPSPRWRAGRNRLEAECDAATGPFKGKRKHSPGGCGIADGTTGRGRSATTRASPWARATCRSPRCSWPSPTPRWPTGARSCARTWRSTSRTPSGRCCRRSTRRPRATSASTRSIWRRFAPACAPPPPSPGAPPMT